MVTGFMKRSNQWFGSTNVLVAADSEYDDEVRAFPITFPTDVFSSVASAVSYPQRLIVSTLWSYDTYQFKFINTYTRAQQGGMCRGIAIGY